MNFKDFMTYDKWTSTERGVHAIGNWDRHRTSTPISFDDRNSVQAYVWAIWEILKEWDPRLTDLEAYDVYLTDQVTLLWERINGLKDEILDEIQPMVEDLFNALVESGYIDDLVTSFLQTGLVDVFGTTHSDFKDILDFYNVGVSNNALLNSAMKKLRNTNEMFRIICRGDSLTYGYDIVSTNRISPDPTPTNKNRVHVRERAPKQYPSVLSTELNSIYPGRITVINEGYSGDTVKSSQTTSFLAPTNADIMLIMFGTNDGGLSTPTEHIEWLRKLVQSANANGIACIVLSPPSPQSRRNDNLQPIMSAQEQFCKENGIPFVDMVEMTGNLEFSYYSDGTHFNDKGYQHIGRRLVALFIGYGVYGKSYGDGDELNVRTTDNGGKYIGTSLTSSSLGPGPRTGHETLAQGFVSLNDSEIIFSFYTERDGMVLLPDMYLGYLGNGKTSFILDRGEKPQPINSHLTVTPNGWTPSSDIVLNNPVDYTMTSGNSTYFSASAYDHFHGYNATLQEVIVIARRGWHTLTVKTSGNVDGFTNLFCIHFQSLKNFMQDKRARPLHKVVVPFGSTTSVSYFDVSIENIEIALGIDFEWSVFANNPYFKITLVNYGKLAREYMVLMRRLTQTGSEDIPIVRRLVWDTTGGNNSNDTSRTISRLEYIGSERKIRIHFGGDLTSVSNLTITNI